MKILIATTNPGKLREIREVIDHASLDVVGLDDLRGDFPEAVEDGDTFEANALKKARHYAALSGLPTLADDSGLEVDALDGRPGVRSARYAEVDGPREVRDPANNRKLLAELAGVVPEQRTARFVCAMALVAPPGQHFADIREEEAITVRGTIEGRILLPEEVADPDHPEAGRGTNGFGYDPLFLVPDLGRTTAEIASEHKNRISHRGHAARLMRKALHDLVVATGG